MLGNNLATLKFAVEVTYALPSNFSVDIDNSDSTQLDLELDMSSDFQLKIREMRFRSDKKQSVLFVTFENEGILPEPQEVIKEKVSDLKKRLLEKFREIGEYFSLLLQLKHHLPPLVLANVKIPSIQIDGNEYKPLTAYAIAHLYVSTSFTTILQPKSDDLKDLIKDAIDLMKLDEKSKDMLDKLKRIIKWYYRALDDSDVTDRFIDYFMILEIWKLYKACKDKDEKCIPKQKKFNPKQKTGIPHKECLCKAIKDLCNKHVFSDWDKEFDNFYNARNNVIHEGLQEETSKHLEKASRCAEKIIEELKKEIQNFLQHK